MPNINGSAKLRIAVILFLLLISFLWLQRCSVFKNLTLEPVISFEQGISQIPKGYFIFIELSGSSVCSYECHCAPGPVKPQYQFTSSGELVTDQPNIIPALTKPIVGFFGDGGVSGGDRLYVIDTLPYKPFTNGKFTIYSIDAQGTAVVDVSGMTYFIKPGQAWTDNGDVMDWPPIGCHMTYSSRFSNYGLVSQAQIRLVDRVP
jgi:hypothetical protein